jgi:hypothetical protein
MREREHPYQISHSRNHPLKFKRSLFSTPDKISTKMTDHKTRVQRLNSPLRQIVKTMSRGFFKDRKDKDINTQIHRLTERS